MANKKRGKRGKGQNQQNKGPEKQQQPTTEQQPANDVEEDVSTDEHVSDDNFHDTNETLDSSQVFDEVTQRNDDKESVTGEIARRSYVEVDTIDYGREDEEPEQEQGEPEPEHEPETVVVEKQEEEGDKGLLDPNESSLQIDEAHESDFESEHVLITPSSPVPPRQTLEDNEAENEQYTVHKEERPVEEEEEEEQDEDTPEKEADRPETDDIVSQEVPENNTEVSSPEQQHSSPDDELEIEQKPITTPLQTTFDTEHQPEEEGEEAKTPAQKSQQEEELQLSPETTTAYSPVQRANSMSSPRSVSSVESSDSKKSASGTVSYESQYNNKDRLVSRLVSNFESQMQDSKPYPKPDSPSGSRSFSRSRAKMIGMSLMNGVNSNSPPASPPNLSELNVTKQRSNDSNGSQEEQNMPKSQSVPGQLSDMSTSKRTFSGGTHIRKLSLGQSSTESNSTEKPNPLRKLSLASNLNNAESIVEEQHHVELDAPQKLEESPQLQEDVQQQEEETTQTEETEEQPLEDISKELEPVPTEEPPKETVEPVSQLGDPVEFRQAASTDEWDEPADVGEINFAADLQESIKQDSAHAPPPPLDTTTPRDPPPRSPEPTITLEPIEKPQPEPHQSNDNLIFGVCVVGFHHHRGPEVEYWVGPDGDKSGIWPYLPFQSLPDGSHSHEENFCYFTLLYDEENKCAPSPVSSKDEEGNVVEKPNMDNVTTLFGIACNRQVRVSEIRNMTSDISRSTVQKSVVVVARKPIFGPIKEKLAVVTRAYFMQGDFEDRQIIDNLYENLVQIFSHKLDESDLNIGMPLRELIYRLGQSVLVILKALLLEKRVLFFASNTELLCASQFSLVSLIPNLISHLEDCGSPLLSKYETTLKKPTSLRTSDRNSLLTFMGLPLQIFADGGVFSPYVPLQQLDEIKSDETRYFMIGSTNSLLLSPKQEIADVVVNMDEDNVQILNTDYKSALTLSASDKKWMDTVVKAVADSWDEEDPWRPKGLGFTGSEDYIRVQFEDYIINLLASVKYDSFLTKRAHQPHMVRSNIEGNPIKLYNMEWVEEWQKTNNYRIFNKFTDEEIFDIVEPKHMASSPTNIDVQRQLIEPKAVEEERKAQQAQQAASGGITKSVTRVFSSFWSEKSPSTANTNGSSQSPKSQSSSRISSPKPSLGTHTPGQESQDRVSLAESIKTAVTNGSNDTTATNSETESGSTKEGYFAGWSRWAASKRRQLAKSTVSVNSTASTESKTDQKE